MPEQARPARPGLASFLKSDLYFFSKSMNCCKWGYILKYLGLASKNYVPAPLHCTVVGKGEINYFSILDFMASEQSLEDIWKLGGQNFEK